MQRQMSDNESMHSPEPPDKYVQWLVQNNFDPKDAEENEELRRAYYSAIVIQRTPLEGDNK